MHWLPPILKAFSSAASAAWHFCFSFSYLVSKRKLSSESISRTPSSLSALAGSDDAFPESTLPAFEAFVGELCFILVVLRAFHLSILLFSSTTLAFRLLVTELVLTLLLGICPLLSLLALFLCFWLWFPFDCSGSLTISSFPGFYTTFAFGILCWVLPSLPSPTTWLLVLLFVAPNLNSEPDLCCPSPFEICDKASPTTTSFSSDEFPDDASLTCCTAFRSKSNCYLWF